MQQGISKAANLARCISSAPKIASVAGSPSAFKPNAYFAKSGIAQAAQEAAQAPVAAPGFGVPSARLSAGALAVGGLGALYYAHTRDQQQPSPQHPPAQKVASADAPAVKPTLSGMGHLTPFDVAMAGLGGAALTGAVMKIRYDRDMEAQRRDAEAKRRAELNAQNRLVRQVSRLQGG